MDVPRLDMNDKDFWEQADKGIGEFHEKRRKKQEQALERKRQKFLQIVKDNKDWKIRVTLTALEIYVMARVLCRSFSIDEPLQKQRKTIFTCKEEKDTAHKIWSKLLLSFRRSSSHLRDRATHPDYREEKWHGSGGDIIMCIKETYDISDNHLDADLLFAEYCYQAIGPEHYRKNIERALNETLKEVKKNGSVHTKRNAERSKREREKRT